ncbi:MAG: response regulator [Provencibacterium sp.]|nr:response regulator [Provencibacterium sp.]
MYTAVLVDDEYWALVALRRSLPWEAYGFHIIGEFMDPEEALEQICEQKPDVVFTDIRMPELSGIDLLRESRRRDIESAFIIISGYGEFIYAQEALQHGAFDYRLKPLQPEEGDEILSSLLKRFQKQKEYLRQMQAPSFPACGNENFQKLLEYVAKNFSDEIYLRDLADRFYLNETYCSVLFKKHTGKNFSDYINDLRIRKAQQLLETTAKSVEEIGKTTGFRDYYYFNKVFKKYSGLTPAQYRRQALGGGEA